MIQFADGRHDQLVQRLIGRPVRARPGLQVQVRTCRAIQHPQRHLQPRPVLAPDQSASRHVLPAPSRRLHADLAAKQRMPAIPHLPSARPAGIMLYGCSMNIAPTRGSATAHCLRRQRDRRRTWPSTTRRNSAAFAVSDSWADCSGIIIVRLPEPSGPRRTCTFSLARVRSCTISACAGAAHSAHRHPM